MTHHNFDKNYLLGVASIVVTAFSIVGVIQKSYNLLKIKDKTVLEPLGSFHTFALLILTGHKFTRDKRVHARVN